MMVLSTINKVDESYQLKMKGGRKEGKGVKVMGGWKSRTDLRVVDEKALRFNEGWKGARHG